MWIGAAARRWVWIRGKGKGTPRKEGSPFRLLGFSDFPAYALKSAMLYEPFSRIGARGFERIGLEKVGAITLGKGVSVTVKKGKGFHCLSYLLRKKKPPWLQ